MAADGRYQGNHMRPVFPLFFARLSFAAPTSAIGAESVPPALLLAERYRGDVDVARYWVSEKLDGIHASRGICGCVISFETTAP